MGHFWGSFLRVNFLGHFWGFCDHVGLVYASDDLSVHISMQDAPRRWRKSPGRQYWHHVSRCQARPTPRQCGCCHGGTWTRGGRYWRRLRPGLASRQATVTMADSPRAFWTCCQTSGYGRRTHAGCACEFESLLNASAQPYSCLARLSFAPASSTFTLLAFRSLAQSPSWWTCVP